MNYAAMPPAFCPRPPRIDHTCQQTYLRGACSKNERRIAGMPNTVISFKAKRPVEYSFRAMLATAALFEGARLKNSTTND
jgi:hypothetical protein